MLFVMKKNALLYLDSPPLVALFEYILWTRCFTKRSKQDLIIWGGFSTFGVEFIQKEIYPLYNARQKNFKA